MALKLQDLKEGTLITIGRTKWEVKGSGNDRYIESKDGEKKKAFLNESGARAELGTYTIKQNKESLSTKLYRGHRTRYHAITGEYIEAQAKSPRTRRVSREKNIELADLPTARDTKIVAVYVDIIKQYRKEEIDAKTFVASLSKDVWTMLRELKAAGKDAFEILDREEFKNTIDKYGAADSVRYLEKLEGYLYNGKRSEFDATKPKKDRLTFVDVK